MASDDKPVRGVRSYPRAAVVRIRDVTVKAVRWLTVHALVAAASVALGLVVVMLATEYGYRPVANAATWAGQPPRYAVGAECVTCHAPEVAAANERRHAAISCQGCHGPGAEHVLAGTGALAESTTNETVSTTCLACHERVLGRPAGFPDVRPATHFGDASCVLCHEVHSTAALAPPRVLHPLDNLPACTVCHGPDGLRPVSDRHPDWPEGDCLDCHLRGASTP